VSKNHKPEILNPKKMMEIVSRLKRKGRMPSPEDFFKAIATAIDGKTGQIDHPSPE